MTAHLLSSPPSLWLILIFLSRIIELWYSLWIVVFLWIYGWYSNGECHYTSNSEVRASSWSNFTKTKFSKIFPKIDFGSLFETRWGRFQLFLTEKWSSALERPCVWLSFPSLGGFWDPNLTSWRSFAVRLRFFREFHPRAISVFFAVFIFFLDGIVQ